MKQKKLKHLRADRTSQSPEVARVHKIQGQIEGVERMIDSHRPYHEVVQQVQAAISALMSLKVELLRGYLNECLAESKQTANYSKLVGRVVDIVRTQIRK